MPSRFEDLNPQEVDHYLELLRKMEQVEVVIRLKGGADGEPLEIAAITVDDLCDVLFAVRENRLVSQRRVYQRLRNFANWLP
jgi:hypothetical protein